MCLKMSQSLAIIALFILCQSVPFCLSSYLARTAIKHSNLLDGKITLHGITVLEAPFIYSESGPYRGYCVDVIQEISKQLAFNYTLSQSPDGQIGTVDLMNGVYGELSKEFAEFAIGPISRSWFNDESKARSAGVLFTIPILTSTMSALVSKNLMRELVNHKKAKCLEKLSGLGNQRTNRRNVTSDVRSFRCNERITIDDVFFSTREQPQLNRLVIKGSAVHNYFSQHGGNLSDLILVEKSSLFSYGLEKLQNNHYVLIDEQKFTEYVADQNCHFDLIYPNGQFNDEMANVKIDEHTRPQAKTTFRNEIVIALSASWVQQHKKQPWKRDWLADFNRAIANLEESGTLVRLQNKHWRSNCRQVMATNGQEGHFVPFLLIISSICVLTSAANLY